MSWFWPSRSTEGQADSLAASGAWPGGGDPIDPADVGYRRLGAGRRDVPLWTLQKARSLSVHAYRTSPMGTAIVDTYTSFCVGDSGLALQCSSPKVREVAQAFWDDSRNRLWDYQLQELLLRSHMLMGETALELMVGEVTGVTRYSYIDPDAIKRVELHRGNPLWPARIITSAGALGTDLPLDVVRLDDLQGLRMGSVLFHKSWQAIAADRRGYPFLAPILDWLDGYDQILWNLIDRTSLARYLVWDVEVQGTETDVTNFIAQRGGIHAPRSGSVEVHNDKVKWEPKHAEVGAREDRASAQQLLTNVAAGAGLAKTWLAEPEDSNRATSLTMAEPVRRRVGGVQGIWLSIITELVRFAVDQAVVAGRLDREIDVEIEEGRTKKIPAAETVTVTGPEIAASDAKVSAEIMLNLATALTGFEAAGILSKRAVKRAAQKGWEDFVGVPYTPDLDKAIADGDTDAAADLIDELEADRGRRGALGLLVG